MNTLPVKKRGGGNKRKIFPETSLNPTHFLQPDRKQAFSFFSPFFKGKFQRIACLGISLKVKNFDSFRI